MARPRTGKLWLERQKHKRQLERIRKMAALAKSRRVTLFKTGEGLLRAVASPGDFYERHRMKVLELTAEQIGTYGPGGEDFAAMMVDDCKAAGVL